MNEGAAANWGVRIALPVGILLGGIALASFFRRPPSPDPSPLVKSPGSISFRQPASQFSIGTDLKPPPAPAEPPARRPTSHTSSAVELVPILQNNPPGLPKSYPQQDSPASRSGLSMEIGASGTRSAEATVPSHKIIDGDTLPALAARYLGDAGRAGEIFEANRNVLASPDILPLGRELKIPAKHERQADVREEPAKGP